MTTERDRVRCHERLERLGESGGDCESIRREAIADLRRVIGFDRWCWPLADPETLLPSSGIAEHDFGPGVPRMLELEYSGDNFAAKHVVARRVTAVGGLSVETGGDLSRSARWDEVMRPVGIGDVATAACRDALGCWGWIEAYRDSDDPPFEEDDLDLLGDIGSSLASTLRRNAMGTTEGPIIEPAPPAMIVLDRDLRPVSWTRGARTWIDALPSASLFARWSMLPSAVYPAATLARSGSERTQARALVHAEDGSFGHPDRDVQPPVPCLCPIWTGTRGRRVARWRTRHSSSRSAPLHLSAHRARSPEVRLRKARHPQPARAAREARRIHGLSCRPRSHVRRR